MTKSEEVLFEVILHLATPKMEGNDAVFSIQSRTQKDPVEFRQKLTAAERRKFRL